MRIGIAVHGRFHAFDLAAALLRTGHDVQLLTNYPRSRVAHWFPAERTHSYLRHGVLSRVARTLARGEPPRLLEAQLKCMFGRWAARRLVAQQLDVMHCWSGVAEESLRARKAQTTGSVARLSAHIRGQFDLLAEEETRVGRRLEKPSPWIIAREEREYQLADRIVVPSEFARQSFVKYGIPAARLALLPFAFTAPAFRADARSIEQRAQRIRSGAPLRIVYTGILSFRKGMHDMLTVLQTLGPRMQFRLVGPALKECADFVRAAQRYADVQPAIPETRLRDVYDWGDIFLLPTIEDGFAVVLAQAQAAGLPILATTNCGAPDIIAGGGQGWIVPVRNAQAIIDQLRRCDEQRATVAAMVEQLYAQPPARTWDDMAREFASVMRA
jgi:colanic acid/amylovoran biosynthesis glycosyltransferase